MIKKSKKIYLALIGIGFLFVIGGVISIFFEIDNRFLSFFSGLGCALVGIAFMNLFLFAKKPQIIKQQEINQNDERFIKIREKSAYATFFTTMFGLVVVEFIFLWLDYSIPCFIVIVLMFVHIISLFLFMFYNSKKL